MSPRLIVLGRENVPCVAEVVNRSLKADCTDFTESSIKSKLITNSFFGKTGSGLRDLCCFPSRAIAHSLPIVLFLQALTSFRLNYTL